MPIILHEFLLSRFIEFQKDLLLQIFMIEFDECNFEIFLKVFLNLLNEKIQKNGFL